MSRQSLVSALLIIAAGALAMAVEFLSFEWSRGAGELSAAVVTLGFSIASAIGSAHATRKSLTAAAAAVFATALFCTANHALLKQMALTGNWSVSSFQHFQPPYVQVIAPFACVLSAALAYWIVFSRRRGPGATGED